MLVPLGRLLGLRRDGQTTVVHLDVDALLGNAREFERRGDDVLLGVFMEVHSRFDVTEEVGAPPTMTVELLLITAGALALGDSITENALKVVQGIV